MLGDFQAATDDAVIDSKEARKNQMMLLLLTHRKSANFARIVSDLLHMSSNKYLFLISY